VGKPTLCPPPLATTPYSPATANVRVSERLVPAALTVQPPAGTLTPLKASASN
jgi:hypothetical protein